MRILVPALLALSLSGCVTVPEQIQGEYPDIVPNRVDEATVGRSVRWGGIILGARNRGDSTCFEILSRELDSYMRPSREDYSNGRYFACKAGFQDPLVFVKGREVTTTGVIRGIQMQAVDDFKLRYPVLDVDTLVLWEKRQQVVVYRGFYDPMYYRYPWGYPYHWGYRPPFGGGWGRAEQQELLPDPAIIEEPSGAQRPGTDDGGGSG